MWKKWEEPQLLSVFSPAEWVEGGGAVKAGTLRIIPQAKVPSPDIMLMSMPRATTTFQRNTVSERASVVPGKK
jgi:hypothetical protein